MREYKRYECCPQTSATMKTMAAQKATTHPPFPEIGSTISSKYFCLGRLGKGTFCSIHKCIDLSYDHRLLGDEHDSDKEASVQKERVVAAKAELATFIDSGVIDSEATVLKFLDLALPPGSVPTFVDYVRPAAGEGVSDIHGAIIMEYLPGEDMHLLRDRHCSTLESKGCIEEEEKDELVDSGRSGGTPRRVSVEDAVYLVADVMLPLLKGMHSVGIVHRLVCCRQYFSLIVLTQCALFLSYVSIFTS